MKFYLQPIGMTMQELKQTVDTFGQILNKFLDMLSGKQVCNILWQYVVLLIT